VTAIVFAVVLLVARFDRADRQQTACQQPEAAATRNTGGGLLKNRNLRRDAGGGPQVHPRG
jgi:hypothetical protein